jgi:CrcB protein
LAVVVLAVTVAGALGVLSRYLLSLPFHGPALPWITVAINVAGSFLLGALVVVDWWSPEIRTAIGVGFLGGFTTFSTFTVQAVLDFEAGEPGLALLYVAASLVLGLGAAVLGFLAGRALMA